MTKSSGLPNYPVRFSPANLSSQPGAFRKRAFGRVVVPCGSWQARHAARRQAALQCITELLNNGGLLEAAKDMANHSDPRATKLYDRRNDETALDEYEKVRI